MAYSKPEHTNKSKKKPPFSNSKKCILGDSFNSNEQNTKISIVHRPLGIFMWY